MLKDDAIRIRHMLNAAHETIAFAKGRNRRDLDTDRMPALSIVKLIEIIWEAAWRPQDRALDHSGLYRRLGLYCPKA